MGELGEATPPLGHTAQGLGMVCIDRNGSTRSNSSSVSSSSSMDGKETTTAAVLWAAATSWT